MIDAVTGEPLTAADVAQRLARQRARVWIKRPWAIRGQKSKRRERMGLLRPKRCGGPCQQFTRQVKTEGQNRKCLSCGWELIHCLGWRPANHIVFGDERKIQQQNFDGLAKIAERMKRLVGLGAR